MSARPPMTPEQHERLDRAMDELKAAGEKFASEIQAVIDADKADRERENREDEK